MILITDLDKTIVYSREYNHKCVERNDNGNPITFMTKNAYKLLTKLLKSGKFTIIPCTLRSFEQTKRIEFTKDGTLPYMICDNGFSIYHNGKLDEGWDKIVNVLINTEAVYNLYLQFNKIIDDNNIPIYRLKSNRNGFISIIFHDETDAIEYKNQLLSVVDIKRYRIEDQGKKIYIVPKKLNKYIAVEYLLSKIEEENENEIVVTSGDSLVDKKFTTLGDYRILPKHATFRHNNAIVTKNEGIYAGEEILNDIDNLMNFNAFLQNAINM